VRIWLVLTFVAVASVANADVIRKWQTPQGTLHLGDNPPPGSVLLETIEFADSAPAAEPPVETDALARAAAEGREIIRRRAAERQVERDRLPAGTHAVYDAEDEDRNVIVVTNGDPFFPHRFHRFSHRRGRSFHAHDGFFGGRDRFFAGMPSGPQLGRPLPRDVPPPHGRSRGARLSRFEGR
jgi:hypothetical protein